MGNKESYSLVNIQKTNWKDPPLFMGKFTISMVIFHSYVKLPGGKSKCHLGLGQSSGLLQCAWGLDPGIPQSHRPNGGYHDSSSSEMMGSEMDGDELQQPIECGVPYKD